jgi:hypothetical protein
MSHYPVQGQDSHGAFYDINGTSRHTNWEQLDAGLHAAHEGLAAMPFYDEFDLSTVDVLLISQYVYTRSAFNRSVWVEGIWRITAVGEQMPRKRCPTQHLVYQNQWNIICILSTRRGDVPSLAPTTCT